LVPDDQLDHPGKTQRPSRRDRSNWREIEFLIITGKLPLSNATPEKGGRGKKKTVEISSTLSSKRLQKARQVLRHSRELAKSTDSVDFISRPTHALGDPARSKLLNVSNLKFPSTRAGIRLNIAPN
jgi:hypothetical protein